MNEQTTQTGDHMILLYRRVGRTLYGHISFYRKKHLDQEVTYQPYKKSSPFVIGQYPTKQNDRLEVFGSVTFLLKEIRRIIKDFIDDNRAWNAERSRLKNKTEIVKGDLRHNRETMDFLILVSTHARNLFDLMPRFNGRSIPRLGYGNSVDGKLKLSVDGKVTLRELFDTLIHNRYYYFDGTYVKDLFSADFRKKKSALSGRFMGYGFDTLGFIQGILEVIHEVRVRDLSQLLRGKFKYLTADSKPQDVIWLVQNVQAFSDLLQTKIPNKEYRFMSKLMLGDLKGSVEKAMMKSPGIKIARDLNKKEFEIHVRCATGRRYQDLGEKDLKKYTVNIGFEDFFHKVNKAFGNDHVLPGKPPQLVSVPAITPH